MVSDYKLNIAYLLLNIGSGLSQRVNHPSSQLHLLHGSLFDVRCTEYFCSYNEGNNFVDPIVPSLAIPKAMPAAAPLGMVPMNTQSVSSPETGTTPAFPAPEAPRELDISDDRVELPDLEPKDLPRCPECKEGLLRPGVVWFGEMLPKKMLDEVDAFVNAPQKIDLIMVIGTSAQVNPAAEYIKKAKKKGAKIAVINMDRGDIPGGQHGFGEGDWFFEGDAATILPEILKDEIGDVSHQAEEKA